MKIKIIGENKHQIQEKKPPENLIFKYIPKISDESDIKNFLHSRFKNVDFKDSPINFIEKKDQVKIKQKTDLDFFINMESIEKLYLHCIDIAQKGLEALGFMIGELRQYKDCIFSIVHDVVTSKLESTSVSVRFHRDAFNSIFSQLDNIKYDYIILGWYHSHPGFSCFMSQIDIDTQKRMFNKVFHAALVVDPINWELKTFRMQDNICIEIPYAIFK
jgi:proteasome lid subunit RPN8/RPN11